MSVKTREQIDAALAKTAANIAARQAADQKAAALQRSNAEAIQRAADAARAAMRRR